MKIRFYIASNVSLIFRGKWQETAGSMPCLYCRKMCCLNGSRKLHFVQKIRLDHIIKYLGPNGFFAHLRNFLQVLDLHIFLQKQPGHWAEVVCIFTFFYISYLFANGNGIFGRKILKYICCPIFFWGKILA